MNPKRKYYLCIQDYYMALHPEETNDFVKYAFNFYSANLTSTSLYNTNADYKSYYTIPNSTTSFIKGRIYHTTDSDLNKILDDYNLAVDIDKVKDHFVEYDFKLEDTVKRIIQNKPNDEILIEPLANSLEQGTFYQCTIRIINKCGQEVCAQYFAYTQDEAIIQCYKHARTMSSLSRALKEWFHYRIAATKPKFKKRYNDVGVSIKC